MNHQSSLAGNCPVCGQMGKLLLDFAQTFHGHRFSLHTCNSCELTYTFPTPSDALLSKIYSGEYWMREKTVQKRGPIVRLVYKFNEVRLIATVKPLLRRLRPGAAILEVGAGSGQLAYYLKQRGYDMEVTDISKEVLEEIWNIYGIRGHCGNLEDMEFLSKYDAIILNNVLEHLPDPVGTLKKAEQLLTVQGIILLEVPNIASLQFKLFGGSWFPLQIPQHLFHFSPASLQKIAHRAYLERIWYSTFSPRISAAGYVASIWPALRPDKIRLSWSKLLLFVYLFLQMLFMPLVFVEALGGRGSAIRVLYRKKSQKS
jgi:2-polyprenyl-3-methyl-5-hydroxy-6-metoxy-1,4-benzoquinol methylase